MGELTFVSRADDLGSSRSANQAIEMVTKAGFIRNVSVMACGPFAEEAAGLLAGNKDICFGMHTTLNAEWDKVKWGPVTGAEKAEGLVDENGYFLADPSLFAETKPQVETIMREVSAQLDYLTRLRFDIRYIDSHMFPEMYVDGLDAAMEEFIRKKGLVDHMYFYYLPQGMMDLGNSGENPPEIVKILQTIPKEQYFIVAHPSLDTEEMRKTGNAAVSGVDVAKNRAKETAIFSDPQVCALLENIGCRGVRYDEAVPRKRRTVEEIKHLLDK